MKALLVVPRNGFALWAIAFLSRKIPDPELAKGLRFVLFFNVVIVNFLLIKYIWKLMWEHANIRDVIRNSSKKIKVVLIKVIFSNLLQRLLNQNIKSSNFN